MDRARDAITSAIAPHRQRSGEYLLNNKFRDLIARS
jgi:hypothetical protein